MAVSAAEIPPLTCHCNAPCPHQSIQGYAHRVGDLLARHGKPLLLTLAPEIQSEEKGRAVAAPRTGILLLGALRVHPQPIPVRMPPQPLSDVPLGPRCDANPRIHPFTCCVLLPPVNVHRQSARIRCVVFRVESPRNVAKLEISDLDDTAAQRHPAAIAL